MQKKLKKAVIITGPGFEDSEVLYPFYRLRESGILVNVVTSNNNPVTGKHGYPIKPTIMISDLKKHEFDAVLVPGGYEAPDRVRQVPEILRFIQNMFKKGKIVSGGCHGPWVFISAGIIKGKHATCYKGMKDDLINAGGLYENKPVVVDENLVTFDHPDNLALWVKETIRCMFK